MARTRGFLEDYDPADADANLEPAVDELQALLGDLFPCNWELADDLTAGDFAFEWWLGANSPVEDISTIFAAALPGSTVTVFDCTEGDRDIYEIAFDGEGGVTERYLVRDGVPVRG